jgi:hypothetical protein
MIGKRSYQPFADERLTHIRMVPVDQTTFARFTMLTPALFWFIEFLNSKYKATQAARTALAPSLFQPVSDEFSPQAIHSLLLPQDRSSRTALPGRHKAGSTRPLLVFQLRGPQTKATGAQCCPVPRMTRPATGRSGPGAPFGCQNRSQFILSIGSAELRSVQSVVLLLSNSSRVYSARWLNFEMSFG